MSPPEKGDAKRRHDGEDGLQRPTDFHEVGEPGATRAVDEQVGLVAHGGHKGRRGGERNGQENAKALAPSWTAASAATEIINTTLALLEMMLVIRAVTTYMGPRTTRATGIFPSR